MTHKGRVVAGTHITRNSNLCTPTAPWDAEIAMHSAVYKINIEKSGRKIANIKI